MSKHWKSAQPSSPPAMSATRPCCPNCSTRSPPIKRSPASPPMVPSTPASAMTPSPPEVPPRSYRPARTQSPGSPTAREQSPATKPCARHAASVEPSGDDGAAITAEAASKRRCDFRQTPGPAPHGAGLRPSGGRVPSKSSRPERLHCPWHTRHSGRRISLSGVSGSLAIKPFVQQSRVFGQKDAVQSGLSILSSARCSDLTRQRLRGRSPPIIWSCG